MLSPIAQTVTTLSLMLSAQASLPDSALAARSPADDRKCTAKLHRHTKIVAVKPVARGAGGIEQRRSPDIQVISFGP